MWYSPGRYPGWVCSARSASRKASPWPGLTWKNRLNSFVGPTLTPGRGAPVAVDAIPASYGPAPRFGPEPTLACCHGHSALTSDADGAGRGRSMLAFRSVVSVLLRALGDFSLHPQGRPCGRPPAAAVLGRQTVIGATYRPELRTSSQTSAQISRTASDCHMTTTSATRPVTTRRASQG